MGKHYIGTKLGSIHCRFFRGYDDKEFDELLERIGGDLPPGYWTWYLEDHENKDNNKKVVVIGKHVFETDYIGAYADPEEFMKQRLRDIEAGKEVKLIKSTSAYFEASLIGIIEKATL